MAYRNPHKKLSKHLLEMKFMKKTKEKAEKQQEDEEQQAMFSNDITQEMINAGSKYIIEPSFVACEDLVMGRMSFRGMNPEIEKLMNEGKKKEEDKDINKDDKSVSDEEMAKRYSTLVGTIGNKFATKRERGNKTQNPAWKEEIENGSPTHKKSRFLKPAD